MMRAISTRGLLAVYLVIPLIVLVILLDHYLFGNVLRKILPHQPEQLLWYTLLFNGPHFFASFFTFADKEYLTYYKRKLMFGIPVIVGLAFLLPNYSLDITIIYLVLYTMYHNVSQQTGVTSIVMKYGGPIVTSWRYLNIFLGLYLYMLVYPSPLSALVRSYAHGVVPVLLFASLILTYFITKKSQTKEGKYYAWGTALIGGVGTLAFTLGYPFFVATTLRIVHDLTAFIFYIVHDQNRNREVMHNLIYRYILPSTSLFIVGIPVLAVALTYIAQGGTNAMVIQAFAIIAVAHFYIEGFMWKNGTPHRREVTFQY